MYMGELPFKYLGIPVGVNPRRVNSWKPLLDNMKNKLLDNLKQLCVASGFLPIIYYLVIISNNSDAHGRRSIAWFLLVHFRSWRCDSNTGRLLWLDSEIGRVEFNSSLMHKSVWIRTYVPYMIVELKVWIPNQKD